MQQSNSFLKDVSIIIPVHNRGDLTEKCLLSLASSINTATYELIVIDNASTDKTSEILDSVSGDITVIRNKTNEGFALACNKGARVAQGEYLLFLNNDTEVSDNFIDTLLQAAKSDSSRGAIGAKLLYPDGRIQHAGIAFNEDGTPYHIFQGFPADHAAVTSSRSMAAVTAACLLIRSNIFQQVGGFDAAYRNGFEDIDLCMKLRLKGFSSYYCAECVVTHHEESSEGRKRHDAENLLMFATRWSEHIQPDDATYLTAHGLKIVWSKGIGKYEALETAGNSVDNIADSRTMIDRAQKLCLEGRHEEAAAILNSIVERRFTMGRDDEFETWQLLGNCMTRLNRAAEAENAYLQAVEKDISSERPFLGLGSVAMLQKNWTAAQYGFLAALARNPDATRAEFGLGVSLAARDKHEQAVKHFQKVVTSNPANADAVFYLYRSAMESNKPEVAISALSEYLELNPNDADFWFHLAGALWKSGSADDAIAACRRVLELNPQHSDAVKSLTFMEQHADATA